MPHIPQDRPGRLPSGTTPAGVTIATPPVTGEPAAQPSARRLGIKRLSLQDHYVDPDEVCKRLFGALPAADPLR